MKKCSVCDGGGAEIVNVLLDREVKLLDIQAQTGFHKSSIHRHAHGSCAHSYMAWRAAKLKAKKAPSTRNAHIFVRWPDGQIFSLDFEQTPFCENALPENAVILDAQYATPRQPIEIPAPIPDSAPYQTNTS